MGIIAILLSYSFNINLVGNTNLALEIDSRKIQCQSIHNAGIKNNVSTINSSRKTILSNCLSFNQNDFIMKAKPALKNVVTKS